MKIQAIHADITALELDAIVNTATCSLPGGGVDGAIHRAADRNCLLPEKDGGCKTGEA